MKKILISIFLLKSIFSMGQVINSNKTTVAQFYNAEVKTIELNGAKVQAQFKLGFLSWSDDYVYKNQPEIRSAQKHNTFFLNLGITNSSSFLNLNKFDFKENNGYVVGATYQHSFSEIYLAADSTNYNPHRLQSWTVSLNYQKDKFKNYNPETDEITTARPEQLILKGGYSLYKFKYRDTAKFKFSWIPSINGQINIIDYNSTKLQNYLLNDLGTEDGEVTFTSSTNFSGKYGVIDNNVSSANLSISSPFVPEDSFWKLPILSPIPYAGVSVFDGDKPRWNAGIALGLLSGSLLDSERKEKAGGIYRKFNVPSFLTIGVDWNYQNGIGSKPNYFITGSIKLK
ncbi:hypothetical protein [Ascidiimonas sp. W6]|uniref:hypothetical protein n=1 Tax=Ascidiimonas meishanensis TaxID=3128903 RepID=UPI0030EB5D2F